MDGKWRGKTARTMSHIFISCGIEEEDDNIKKFPFCYPKKHWKFDY